MATEYVIRDGRRIEVETLPSRVAPKRRKRADQHIGCPARMAEACIAAGEDQGAAGRRNLAAPAACRLPK